jgi:hypothetical protein
MRPLIERIRALDPESPWIPFLEAYFHLGCNESGSALAAFEGCLRQDKGIRMMDGNIVPIISAPFMSQAIEDYIRLALSLGYRPRIVSTLERLMNHPDPRLQRQASLYFIMLRGEGGAQA